MAVRVKANLGLFNRGTDLGSDMELLLARVKTVRAMVANDRDMPLEEFKKWIEEVRDLETSIRDLPAKLCPQVKQWRRDVISSAEKL